MPTTPEFQLRAPRNILTARKYVILLLLLSVLREKLAFDSDVSVFWVADPRNIDFRRANTPLRAVNDIFSMVHFARGEICSQDQVFSVLDTIADCSLTALFQREPIRDLLPLARYEVPPGARIIPDEYIVYLRPPANPKSHFQWIGIDLAATKERFRYLRFINAYRAKLPMELVQDLIRCDPQVYRVEPDIEVRPDIREEMRSVPRRPASNFRNVRKWRKVPSYRLKWWNKMIIAGRRIANWDTYLGVSNPKIRREDAY